ncbi:MAG TPA: hypothetical protein VFX51_05300, partial [Solirubrobacteraceae bacterium]|nr:hypothetical protein [Solirubrobacteraceae bacterium]
NGPLALQLDVGLDDSIDPLWQRDLDNYLFPIARELPTRYVSVWGTKGRAAASHVTVGRAVPASVPEWLAHPVPRASGGETSWKHAVRDALASAEVLPPGPVGVQLALTVGPDRRWTNAWKSTIDALEPLLGRTYPDRDWNPQDGRIVRIGLHVTVDDGIGHEVEATIWATPGNLDWPELSWLKRMSKDERHAFLSAHQANLDRIAATAHKPRPTKAPPSKGMTAAASRRGRPPRALPAGVSELKTEDDFTRAVTRGALMVNTDSAGPPKLHLTPERCVGVSVDNFRLKVIVGGGENGRYYQTEDPVAAQQRWPRLAICGTCRRLDPAAAAAIEAVLG